MAKATNAEIDQRLTEVQELLLEGRTRHFIVQHGSKWNISNRQIDDYISQATALIKEINAASVQDNMARITTNLWKLYRAAQASTNLSEANKILMNIAKLKGLEQSTCTVF